MMTATVASGPETQNPTRIRWWEPVVLFAMVSAILWALTFYYDDVHRATTNGLWKAIEVDKWVKDSPQAYKDPSNLLYYPFVSTAVQLFPGAFPDTVWQRMAYLNAMFGAG